MSLDLVLRAASKLGIDLSLDIVNVPDIVLRLIRSGFALGCNCTAGTYATRDQARSDEMHQLCKKTPKNERGQGLQWRTTFVPVA